MKISIVLAGLFCFLFPNLLSAQSCEANLSSSGTPKSGLTFTGSVSLPGLTPRSAIGQLKEIVGSDQGFELGAESYQGNEGTFSVKQKQSNQSRGFPIYFVANSKGEVTFRAVMPSGMNATRDNISNYFCGKWLDKLQAGSSGDALAAEGEKLGQDSKSGTDKPYIPPVAFSTAVEDTPKICAANFSRSTSGSLSDGQIYTTWALTSTFDPRDAVERLKRGIATISDSPKTKGVIRVVDSEVHGSKASLMFSIDNVDIVSSGAFFLDSNGTNKAAIPYHIDFDGALGAVSFVIRLSENQYGISDDRLKWLACTTVALATGADLPPAPPKIGGGRFQKPQFHNPLKDPLKAQQEKQDKEMVARLGVIAVAWDTLFERALAQKKSFVVIPALNVDTKYKQYTVREYGNGGPKYPEFLADVSNMLIWENKQEPKDQIKVGVGSSNTNVGISGWVGHFSSGNAEYQLYIVDPGTYNLMGNTYELARLSMPDMSSAQWTTKPAIGIASLIPKRNTEFYQTQEWFNAQYQNKTYTSSYCDLAMGGGNGPCVSWGTDKQTVTEMTDPGGWRTVTNAKLVDGVAIATKLAKPFASFTVAPGESILVDGFYTNDHNTGINTNACKQNTGSLVDCGISNYTLFRIPAKPDVLKNAADGAEKIPNLRKIYLNTQYRPLKISATPEQEKPGTFEAGWSTPYGLR